MKITEKLYIERLEKMVKEYNNNPCDHCPMIENYGIHRSVFLDDDEDIDGDKDDRKACTICRKLTAKYNNLFDYPKYCPCGYYKYKAFTGDGVPEGHMVNVAWNVIRGWKHDNKDELTSKE